MLVHKDANFFFNINRDDFSTECYCSTKLIILLKLMGRNMPFYVYMNIRISTPKNLMSLALFWQHVGLACISQSKNNLTFLRIEL